MIRNSGTLDLYFHNKVVAIRISHKVIHSEDQNQMACFIQSSLNPIKRQIFDSFKLKEFADDNFTLNENGSKFSKWVENTAGKGEIASYNQFLLFPQCFQKPCTVHM